MDSLARAYLAGWCALATTALGALALALLGDATGARWIAAVRAPLARLARAIVPLAILFVPIVLLQHTLYPAPDHPAWSAPAAFTIRAAILLGTWIVVAEVARVPRPSAAGPLLLVLGLTLTLASFDWLMALLPGWWSAAYGCHVICGALLAGCCAAILFRPLPDQLHAFGRLLLALVVLWGYIAFFEAMLIQIADQPKEVVWYLPRLRGAWAWATAVLAIGHLGLPLFALLPRAPKFHYRYLAVIAVWLLAMHALDLVWLCLP